MKKIFIIMTVFFIAFLGACGGGNAEPNVSSGEPKTSGSEEPSDSVAPSESNPTLSPDNSYGEETVDFSITQPKDANNIVNGDDFGFDTSAEDNTPAFLRAAEYPKENPGTVLLLEKGTYYFSPEQGVFLYQISDSIIDGNGSEFIFDVGNYFYILDCDTLLIRNITIDWDWNKGGALASLVRVKSVTGNTVVFEFSDVQDAAYAVDEPWETVNQFDPETFTPGCAGGKEVWELTSLIASKEHIGGNLISVCFNSGAASNFKAEQVYLLRHRTYCGSVFYTGYGSQNITYDNITIYGAYGAGFVSGTGAHHTLFSNITIGLRPETKYIHRISTTVDAFHIADTGGYFIMENCDISFQGDDALNVHDNVGTLLKAYGNTLAVSTKSPESFEEDCILAFKASSDFSDIELSARVKAIEKTDIQLILTLDREIGDIAAGTIVYNADHDSGHYIIRNNYFHENRARGLLLGSDNGLVENNRFYKTQGAAILIPVDICDSWTEGTGVENLVIRQNEFNTCNVNDWSAVVEFVANYNGSAIKGACFNKIVFCENTFIDFPSGALLVRSTVNSVFSSNIIKNASALGKNTDRGRMKAEYSGKLTFLNNKWISSPYMTEDINEIRVIDGMKGMENIISGNVIEG